MVAGTTPPLLFPPPDLSQALLPPDSPLSAPVRFSPLSVSPTKFQEPTSRATSPITCVCHARHVHPPPVPSTHMMALRPSSVSQPVVLPLPPLSSLLDVLDPVSDLARAASPAVTRFPTTLVIDPTFFTTAASPLVAELADFAATCHLDYLASLVSDPAYPTSIGGELALGCDVLEDSQFELEYIAAASPHLAAMLLAPEGVPDALDISIPCSYVEATTGRYSS
ncbi:unnamed protein product [Closterium sp. NIES-53]